MDDTMSNTLPLASLYLLDFQLRTGHYNSRVLAVVWIEVPTISYSYFTISFTLRRKE